MNSMKKTLTITATALLLSAPAMGASLLRPLGSIVRMMPLVTEQPIFYSTLTKEQKEKEELKKREEELKRRQLEQRHVVAYVISNDPVIYNAFEKSASSLPSPSSSNQDSHNYDDSCDFGSDD